MDSAEMLSQAFLRSQGFNTVEYEPDGNIPPDFLCDGQIAVEVRRLNHHFEADGEAPESLDKKGVAIWNTVKEILREIGPPTHGQSWWVCYTVRRPIKGYKDIPRLLKKALLEFRDHPRDGEQKIAVVEGFSVKLVPAEIVHDLEFVFASASDRDSAGWLLDMMEKNLQLCIDEKSKKIDKVRANYQTWWLVLVDMIGWGLSEFDQELFRDSVSIEKRDWAKIILIDPHDPGRYFEI
ncbi:hypothetical protein LIS66_19965 [Pseudomonas sp. HN2]|uniref:hypothetical protein n=1 Tax=Pseudomonas sp. HN2 TaxID=2884805 RepID=UPI001D13A177|nr:hypothetical protein [Pseudomonas sp. HN2]UEB94638.1 hypothetical protein LIS66_19965 [Pseudomonas sp. HN2]